MANNRYTGAWRDRHTFMTRALDPARGVDPSHGRPDLPDSSRPPSGAPRMDLAPMYATEDTDAAYSEAVDTPGLVFSFEPEGHNTVDLSGPVPNPQHRVDQGATVRQHYEEHFMRRFDERPTTVRFENLPTVGDLTVSGKRGTNSLPQNNPEGYRYGWVVKRYLHRRMFDNGASFRHSDRLLRPVTAAGAVQSPATQNPNRYVSPFSWNKKLINTGLQFPILRRDPLSVSGSVQSDGTEEPSPIVGDWVL